MTPGTIVPIVVVLVIAITGVIGYILDRSA
jgi:hypothetical protein